MKKKDDYIKVRLSKEEKEKWQEKAVRAGLSLSNLIRQSVEKSKTWTIQDRGLIAEHTRQIRRIGINLNQIAKWANTYGSTAEAIKNNRIQARRDIFFPICPPVGDKNGC